MNLTAEWMWVLGSCFQRNVTVWAPSPREEAKAGFDASIDVAGFSLLVQYKAAKWSSRYQEWRFKLNETKGQDQHAKLVAHAKNGTPTYYGLPLFDDYATIRNNARNLLGYRVSAWINVASLPIPNNGIGKHQLGIRPSQPYKVRVYSEPVEVEVDTSMGGLLTHVINASGQRWPSGWRADEPTRDTPPPPPPEDGGEDGEGEDEGGGSGLVGFHIR
ncbi:hypothetical protein [Reyranella massiliensis]|uniref:hypothetical protein n=1 Tax=Reyranella massiliensis TaxID=445220 RepID=UPI0011D1E0BB|nr:hypothetical protein [Reyranella massiliensis]